MCGDLKYCYVEDDKADISPEASLANLMRSDLNVNCTPREVRMFIRANWRYVSALAHKIHESGEPTASEAPR